MFWWGGTAPLLARSLNFQVVVANASYISSNNSWQKASPVASKHHKRSWRATMHCYFNSGVSCTLQTLCGTVNTPYRWGEVLTDVKMWRNATNIQLVVFLYEGFNSCIWLWVHYMVCLTQSWIVCHRTHAVLRVPTPLIHWLDWQVCITILDLNSPMNF